MIRTYIVAFVLLLLTGGALEAQNRQPGRVSDSGPIATLLQMREELRLTREQVVELRRIDDETDRLNRPYLSALREIRNRARTLGPLDQLDPENQAKFDAYMAEARPLLDRIHENTWAAMREVGGVLSSWQKERMRELLRNANEDRERSGRFPPPHRSGQ